MENMMKEFLFLVYTKSSGAIQCIIDAESVDEAEKKAKKPIKIDSDGNYDTVTKVKYLWEI